MTCIIGIETGNGVLIGGDSAGTGGYSQTIRADEKVWKAGEFVCGFTSSYRMGQLLRHSLTIPQTPHLDVGQAERDKWMTTVYIDAVRKCLKEGGYTKVENGVEQGGLYLVGWRGTLYTVERDFQVGRSTVDFHAVGSGEDLAMGAMAASASIPGMSPRERVKQALEISARFNAAVGGPFHLVEVKTKTP
jgi:ATP-dependent protease HslVU (ClpYQ) peptidase subunit